MEKELRIKIDEARESLRDWWGISAGLPMEVRLPVGQHLEAEEGRLSMELSRLQRQLAG